MSENKGEARLMTPLEKIMSESRAEVTSEIMEKYKSEVKTKLRSLAQAQKVVRNIEAEIEDLQMRLEQELA